ncbi:arsenate reductase family protein [Aquimarina sp. M1]
MGVISTDKNKITLIYNSENSIGKQTLGYVKSSKKKILSIDTSKTNIANTQWIEIKDRLGIDIDELIDKQHPKFNKSYGTDARLEVDDWLKIINNHPEVIRGPILILGEKFYQIENPSDFVKLIEPDSAGVSRNPSKKEE